MTNIQPRTYNEALRLSKCFEVQKYVSDLKDDQIETMYAFLTDNPLGRIFVAAGMISFINENAEKIDAFTVDTVKNFENLEFGNHFFNIKNKSVEDSHFDSGNGSSDSYDSDSGGGSSNNNNNNNG